MFETETLVHVDGVDVLVRRRPGKAVFDITYVKEIEGAPGGFTVEYFSEGGGAVSDVSESAIRDEIAGSISGLREEGFDL
jgi:hypothetical protein